MGSDERAGELRPSPPELQPSPPRAATAGAAVTWVKAATRTAGKGGDRQRGRPARAGTGDANGHRRACAADEMGGGGPLSYARVREEDDLGG